MIGLRDALTLARWHNALIAAAGVLIGAWWARSSPTAVPVLLTAIVAACLTTFANAYNDACDAEIDRLSHPERPIPSGRVTVEQARALAWIAAALGCLLSLAVTPMMVIASAAILLVMREYSLRIKRHGLPGNVVVAILAALPFVYGAWSAGHPSAGVTLLLLAAPLHFAREIAKDLDDVAGDEGARATVPIALGRTVARRLVVISVAGFLLMLLPLTSIRPAFALALVPALVVTLLGAWRVAAGQIGGAQLFKSAMLLAMTALVVAPPR